MDGLDNTARRNNRQIRLVINTPEAVEQTQVVSNSYSAEFGRAAGGQINVITRSGTNQYHGSALGLYRPNDLSARPGLNQTKPEATRYDMAFTLGGPIISDKLFFFGQYEYNPLTGPIPVTITAANAAAETLRNLIVTAWARSGASTRFDPGDNPISPNHPKYNPATGSAPAPLRSR